MVGMVREFHKKYGHTINEEPTIPDDEVIELRYKLIEEEMSETLGALREIMNDPLRSKLLELELLADGIADSIVVLLGTAISFGIPINEVFSEVHRSNMTKSMEKDTKSIKGKTLKGDAFEPPRIKTIIMNAVGRVK